MAENTINLGNHILSEETLAGDMQVLAKGLAQLFKEEHNRKLYESEKILANNRDEIVDLSRFINSQKEIIVNGNLKNTNFLDAICSILPKEATNQFKEKYKNLSAGVLDLYFPIVKHMESWTSSDKELLVAAVDPRESKKGNKGNVKCYNKDSNITFWNAKEVPSVPILAIHTNELGGKYLPKVDKNSSIFKSLRKNSAIANITDIYVISDLKVHHVFLRDPGDDIFDGRPEYYVEAKTSLSSSWTKTYFTDCYEETGYWPDRTIYTYSGSLYNLYMKVFWWEEDSPNNQDIVEQSWSLTDGGSGNENIAYGNNNGSYPIYYGTNCDILENVYWKSR